MNSFADVTTQAAFNELISAAMTHAPQCRYCLDTNIYQVETGIIACPARHSEEFKQNRNAAAVRLTKAVWYRVKKQLPIEPTALEIARLLTLYTTDQPVKRETIDRFAGTEERMTKKYIERLRSDWLLPIGSRKFEPAGYWIIVTAEDYLEWEREFRRSPITQLTTCYHLRRANFPALAGQTEMDFAAEISKEMNEAKQ